MTSHWFKNETTFAPCDTTVQSGKNTACLDCTLDIGKNLQKKVWIKLLDRTEMGYNDIQTVNYWVNQGFGVIILQLLHLRCEFERVFPQTSTELGMW
jgi:hypothetical protein